MKPSGAIEYLLPLDIAGLCQRNCAMLAVINNARRALIGPRLLVINTETSVPTRDSRGVDPEAPQFGYSGIGDGMILRQDGDVCRFHAKCSKCDGNVGFRPSKSRRELWILQQALEPGRR